MMSDYMSQIDNILNSSSMSELMTVKHEIMNIKLYGMFYSGIYSEYAPASYAPKRGAREDYFQCSLASIRANRIEPKELTSLTGIIRGKEYKIVAADYGECGTVMLILKPTGGEVIA